MNTALLIDAYGECFNLALFPRFCVTQMDDVDFTICFEDCNRNTSTTEIRLPSPDPSFKAILEELLHDLCLDGGKLNLQNVLAERMLKDYGSGVI